MTDAEEKNELIRLYRSETKAVVDKDISTLNRILAPSMEMKLVTGFVLSKMQWIDQVQNEDIKYYSTKEERIRDIQIDHNKASLIGQNQVKAAFWNKDIKTIPLQARVYFVKDNGRWVITRQDISAY